MDNSNNSTVLSESVRKPCSIFRYLGIRDYVATICPFSMMLNPFYTALIRPVNSVWVQFFTGSQHLHQTPNSNVRRKEREGIFSVVEFSFQTNMYWQLTPCDATQEG
jgi:hypothetical protein